MKIAMVEPSISLVKRTIVAYTVGTIEADPLLGKDEGRNMGILRISGIEQRLPAFDTDPDGFPRPGRVLRYFRQKKLKANGKPWTQREVAQVLGCRELAVRAMELQDTGLNDIARRRFLAELLDIPLELFGLVPVPTSQETNAAGSTWWVQQGFPAFDAGPDGFPRPGQVIRRYRQTKLKADGRPWTQHDLAQVLGKQSLAVREMELKDIGLNDISRRRFLSHLFDIPPLLLGLIAPSQRPSGKRPISPASFPRVLIVSEQVDLEEIRDRLTGFWMRNADTPQNVLLMLDSTLKRLYEQYPTARSSDRLKMVTALCELHIHSANLLRDRGKFGKFLEHLNMTKDLSTLVKEDELQADVLYRRGGGYLERGEFTLALHDYHAAEQKLIRVSPPLQAAILLETALCEARVASSRQQCLDALKKLDRAGQIIRREHTEEGREEWPYLKVDLDRYHLDRAATLIIVGNPEEAQQELRLLSSPQLIGRRSVYHLILQAQACFGLEEYPQTALLLEAALPLARAMRSQINFGRIKTLYKRLQQTSFRNNPEVGRLDYLLFHS